MGKNNKKEWHWFKGGILVSLLSLGTFFGMAELAGRDYPFGVTSGFGHIAGIAGSLIGGLSDNPVILKYAESKGAFITLFILLGIIAGGWAASRTGGNHSSENIPAVWEKYHGKSRLKRYLFVLAGSICLGFGAALAGGCTTGNILQGWSLLSTGSMAAGVCIFAAGIITAKILYSELRGKK